MAQMSVCVCACMYIITYSKGKYIDEASEGKKRRMCKKKKKKDSLPIRMLRGMKRTNSSLPNSLHKKSNEWND